MANNSPGLRQVQAGNLPLINKDLEGRRVLDEQLGNVIRPEIGEDVPKLVDL